MVARHFFCYCEWIGQPPEDFSIDQDIDIYNMYMPKITEDEIQVDAHPHGDVVLDKTKINVYMDSNEPDFYAPCCIDTLREKSKHFDVILTRRPELLDLPNARLFLFGTQMVENWETVFDNKIDAVSYTMTGKKVENLDALIESNIQPPDGYAVRHMIGHNFSMLESEHSRLPLHGYDSEKFPSLYESLKYKISSGDNGRLELMKYKFHIAVENSSLPNYMTEKLHDCFLTKTVPIYYGCPNIADHYDMGGVLKFETGEQLVNILRNLSPELYDKMKTSIDENYERVLPLSESFNKRFYKAVEKALLQ